MDQQALILTIEASVFGVLALLAFLYHKANYKQFSGNIVVKWPSGIARTHAQDLGKHVRLIGLVMNDDFQTPQVSDKVVMKMPETGKLCKGLVEAIDEKDWSILIKKN